MLVRIVSVEYGLETRADRRPDLIEALDGFVVAGRVGDEPQLAWRSAEGPDPQSPYIVRCCDNSAATSPALRRSRTSREFHRVRALKADGILIDDLPADVAPQGISN
jgi:hypothetical protein